MELKTPECSRRAIEKYRKAREQVTILFPPGTKERIQNSGHSVNAFVNKVVKAELEQLENS